MFSAVDFFLSSNDRQMIFPLHQLCCIDNLLHLCTVPSKFLYVSCPNLIEWNLSRITISERKGENIIEKITISLTQFLDYSLKQSGPGKVSSVRKIKYDEYNVAGDFWKALREAIPKYHEGELSFDYLEHVASKASDKRKGRYMEAVKSYKQFLGRKEVEWFDPGKSFWTFQNLAVKSGGEVGLIINGQPRIIKLYFKQDAIDKRRSKTALALMGNSVKSDTNINALHSILDVNKNKIYLGSEDQGDEDIILALQGEAAQFIQIWNSV